MQFIIDNEISYGIRLAVDKLTRVLNSRGELVRELDAPGEETAFLIGLPDRSAVVDGALAAAADGNYADDLVFGFREKRHCGHWRDDLAVVERDLATIAKLTPHGETIHVETMLWPGGEIHPQPPEPSLRHRISPRLAAIFCSAWMSRSPKNAPPAVCAASTALRTRRWTSR